MKTLFNRTRLVTIMLNIVAFLTMLCPTHQKEFNAKLTNAFQALPFSFSKIMKRTKTNEKLITGKCKSRMKYVLDPFCKFVSNVSVKHEKKSPDTV